MSSLESYHPGVGKLGETESLCHVDTGCSTPFPVFCRVLPGDAREDQERPGGWAPTGAQQGLYVALLRLPLICEEWRRCSVLITKRSRSAATTSRGGGDADRMRNTKAPLYLTSARLGVGHINKAVHHLAHLLDLRSRAVNWATWLISSFKGKKFIACALLLHSGSLPLCPAQQTSFDDGKDDFILFVSLATHEVSLKCKVLTCLLSTESGCWICVGSWTCNWFPSQCLQYI